MSRFTTPTRLWVIAIVGLWTISLFAFNYQNIKIRLTGVIVFPFLLYLQDHLVVHFSILEIAFPIALFLLFTICKNSEFGGLAVVFTITGLFEALHGIGQYFGFFVTYYDKFSPTGNFNNPAGYAVVLSALFPFALYTILDKNTYKRILGSIAVISIVIAVCLSGSRAGIFAICISLIVSFYFYAKKRGWITWRKIILPILVIIMLVICLYFLKKDSADGRLLIWRCSLKMIAEKPLLGHGHDSFQTKYMVYQANYFSKNPTSKFAYLADNTWHPFNEYLKLIIEHGIIGFLLFIMLVIVALNTYYKNKSKERTAALLSLIAIATMAFFSYPLSYPITWVLMIYSFSTITKEEYAYKTLTNKHSITLKTLGFAFSIMMLYSASRILTAETKWNKTALNALSGSNDELKEYEQLHKEFKTNGLFLYNYGVELNQRKRYTQSKTILTECMMYFNDYDLQLLQADNNIKLNDFRNAEKCLLLTSNMCPNRFVPLYQLVDLYDKTNCNKQALTLAKEIVTKPIKIPSSSVFFIKDKMNKYIKEHGESNLPLNSAY